MMMNNESSDDVDTLREALIFLIEQEKLRGEEVAALNDKIESVHDYMINNIVNPVLDADKEMRFNDFSSKYGERLGKYGDFLKNATNNPEYDVVKESFNELDGADADVDTDEYVDSVEEGIKSYVDAIKSSLGLAEDDPITIEDKGDGEVVVEGETEEKFADGGVTPWGSEAGEYDEKEMKKLFDKTDKDIVPGTHLPVAMTMDELMKLKDEDPEMFERYDLCNKYRDLSDDEVHNKVLKLYTAIKHDKDLGLDTAKYEDELNNGIGRVWTYRNEIADEKALKDTNDSIGDPYYESKLSNATYEKHHAADRAYEDERKKKIHDSLPKKANGYEDGGAITNKAKEAGIAAGKAAGRSAGAATSMSEAANKAAEAETYEQKKAKAESDKQKKEGMKKPNSYAKYWTI